MFTICGPKLIEEERKFVLVGTDRIGPVYMTYFWTGVSEGFLQPIPKSRPKWPFWGAKNGKVSVLVGT